jgi:two-component system, NtrC family, sensor histidine kinase HydH
MGSVTRRARIFSRLLVPVVIVALPLVLLLSSVRTFQALEEQKAVYLRNHVAILAGRLENLPATGAGGAVFDQLSADEPSLIGLELIERGKPGDDPRLQPIWDGQELFSTGFVREGGEPVYRAYVPFHSGTGLRIARMDLDGRAADFLVVHARHNIVVASLGAVVLVALSLYGLWATRRAARFELQRMELEHLAHMGKMAAVLAHEIRNPLGTIKGFAQLAGEKTDASVRPLLEPILSETGRLENLVSDLLLYGRPPVPSMRTARWEETLGPLRAHAREIIGARDIRFVPDNPSLEWETDPHLLLGALLNLVRNAADAIGEAAGGEIRLEVSRQGSRGLALSVIDNGPGISETARSRLFEPFFTTKAFGTGLGLAITRRLAQSLGGELVLNPARPHGTEATLLFSGVPAAQLGQT